MSIVEETETLVTTSTSDEQREFNVIIWGATGYTGHLAAEYMVERAMSTGSEIKWALGGRNRSSLESLGATLRKKFHLPNPIRYVFAESDNYESMKALTEKCSVFVAMAGPYTLCGEAAIRACLATSTHYLDITAEMVWVQEMVNKYSTEVAAKKLRFVPCCGFDFVPNDMMMLQLSEVLANPVHAKWAAWPRDVTHSFRQSTPMVSGGTALSGLQLVKSMDFKTVVQYYVDPYAMCSAKTKSNVNEVVRDMNSLQISPHYVPESESYCTPFVMSSLMHKFIHWSNELQGYPWGLNLIYRGGERRQTAFMAYLYSAIIWLQFFFLVCLARMPFAWKYLPAPGTGSPLSKESDFMESILVAKVPPASSGDNPLTMDADKTFKVTWTIKGMEAYRAAAMFIVEAALTMVFEEKALPERYGVLSVAAALGPTYLRRLENTPLVSTVEEIK